MSTVGQRLDKLSAALQANIDEGAVQVTDLDTAIAASVAAIAATQTEINVITAIAAGSRTEVQKAELRGLRKDIALQRALLDSQRLNKKLVRNDMAVSRFGLLFHGGPAQVRDADLNGSDT
jgi:hypothetical protein